MINCALQNCTAVHCTRLHYTTAFQVFFGPPSPEIEEQFLSQVSYQHVPTFDIVQHRRHVSTRLTRVPAGDGGLGLQ